MPSVDFSPKKIIEKTISKWWLLLAVMISGGFLGCAVSAIQPPRYETYAQVSTSIDYSVSPEIEDYMEDRAINETGWLMISESVLKNVQAQAAKVDVAIPYQEILDSFAIERIDDLWTLRVVGDNPEEIALLANLWVKEASEQLDDAIEHAQKASVVEKYLSALEECPESELSICTLESADALTAEIEENIILLNEELELSRALLPTSRVTLVSTAPEPTAAVYQSRGILVLSGALLGLLGGLVYLFITIGRDKADA